MVEVLVDEDEIIVSLDSVLEEISASEAVEVIVVEVVVEVVEEEDEDEDIFISVERVLDERLLSEVVVEDVVDEGGATVFNVDEAVDEGGGVLEDMSVVLIVLVVDKFISLVDVFGFSVVEETSFTDPGVTTFVVGNTTVSKNKK